MACVHDHSCEDHDCSSDFSLYKHVDLSKVCALNEAVSGSVKSVFKAWEQRLNTSEGHLESNEGDPELLVIIPFTSDVKIKSISIVGKANGTSPSKMRAFINREGFDFSDAQSMRAVQEWDLVENLQGALEYQTKYSKFQGVGNLTLHFPDNFGGDTTQIHYIGLKGEATQLKRDVVATFVYEIMPNPTDHKTESGTFKDGDLLVNQRGLRIVDHNDVQIAPLIQPSGNQISLADFDAVKVIGKGSGGVVRLVQHKCTKQFFALKVIEMNIEESVWKQIAQELKINQSSQCPYVVVCYESFYDNGAVSIILEYMDGGSLANFLKKVKTIPEPYLAAICKQVLKGLWYLHHEKHIIHRDMKPSNLLINHRGEVKITVFGVGAILASTSGQANTFVGTYNYMSPERIIGGKYDYSSDIWSLGLVLLECAMGNFPYSPPQQNEGWVNVYEHMIAIVEHPPPSPPSDLFSPEFCSFISECLQKEPKDRKSSNELMNHPFIRKYDDLDIDLAVYFTEAGSPLATL